MAKFAVAKNTPKAGRDIFPTGLKIPSAASLSPECNPFRGGSMMRFSVRRSMAAAAISAMAVVGTTATAQATPANSEYEPVTGIQNCWVGGHTWFGVQGGEVEVAACYDIQKDDQGYKAASVIRIRREEGTPAPVNITTFVTGGEDQNATAATVDVSKDSVWHEVRSPWNRASGVYHAYGSYFAPGMKDANGWPVTAPRELDFMHNGHVWLPSSP